jgi:hypothetical protein
MLGQRETLVRVEPRSVWFRANMSFPDSPPQRRTFTELSIARGNTLQIAGLALACVAMEWARFAASKPAAVFAMVAAWLLLYFFCHGIAHWNVGRILGIRFAFYTVGGTGNPQGYPAGLRWIFERLPFFGVQTQKASMQTASPKAKAIMWCAGVTSSAVVPTLGALWAWHARIPGSKWLLLFSAFWSLGTLASNWRSAKGDFAKARRALGS